jgi:membrane protease YdiL (CAAX protease family)
LYHAPAFTPAEAWWLLAVGVGIIYGVQIATGAFLVGIAASAIADVLCIAFFVWYARRRRVGWAGLGFAHARPKYLFAGVLIGCSAWYVNLVIITLLHVPEGPTEIIKNLIVEQPFLPTMGAIAVLPAVAEEIVFRGVLARSLATQKRLPVAIVISSAVFGIYHIVPAQMAATFMLGCVLSLLTLRARSIVPAVIAHFLNNAIALIVTREETSAVSDVMQAHPVALLGITVGLLASGLVLVVPPGNVEP